MDPNFLIQGEQQLLDLETKGLHHAQKALRWSAIWPPIYIFAGLWQIASLITNPEWYIKLLNWIMLTLMAYLTFIDVPRQRRRYREWVSTWERRIWDREWKLALLYAGEVDAYLRTNDTAT